MSINMRLMIALLVAIATLASACGGPVTSNGVGSNDAAPSTETAVREDAASQPDVAPRDDAGPTPPPDASRVDVAVAPDAPTPPPDVPAVEDRAVPADTGMLVMRGFDPALCAWIHASLLRVHGSTMRPESPQCYMEADGSATMIISNTFAAAFGCGNSEGNCSGTSCSFGTTCGWTGLMIGAREFQAHSSRMAGVTIDVMTP